MCAMSGSLLWYFALQWSSGKSFTFKKEFYCKRVIQRLLLSSTQPSVSSTCADLQDAPFVSFLLHSFFELLNVTFIKKKINANECFSIGCGNLTLNPQIIIIINHHIMAYQGYTVGHYARASSGLVGVKPRKQIIYIPGFEQEIKLVRLWLNSNSQYFAFSNQLATIPAELTLCQPEEIVIIPVREERVLSENWLERKRQSDQRKQEVKGVKRVKKFALESWKGCRKKAEYGKKNAKENKRS